MEKFDICVGNKIYEWNILSINDKTCTCKCSCGVVRDVNTRNLSYGLSKSCGHTRRNDITGNQFGEWKVLEYVGRRNRKSFYLCECSCGKQKEIRSYDLTHGATTSCGHKLIDKHKDMVCQKFGEWEVLKVINCRSALCVCSCGVEKEVDIQSLKNGTSKSCGHSTNKCNLSVGDVIDDVTLISKNTGEKWRCKCKCGVELNISTYELNKYRHICHGNHKVAFRDLTGNQINEWNVLEYLGESLWKCKCSCGNIVNKRSYDIVTGISKHCTSYTHANNKIINIKGQKFGKLTVVEYEKPYWKCRCDCGKSVYVLSHNLRNGSTTSCGCSKILFSREDLISAINQFDDRPFIFELAELLNVHESTARKYINKYDLHNYINKSFRSRYEKEIVEHIENNGIHVITSDRTVLYPLELDIYIPSHNLAIEFNGNYWHSSNIKDKYYHQNKTIACAKQGIRLIHIFEYEWVNSGCEKIIEIVDNALNTNIEKIYARNTVVQEVQTDDAKKFLDINHIQGWAASSINIGCYYNSELIGIMTFGKPRFNNNYQYELIRYCWKSHINVVGGAEKLFKYFIKNNYVDSIITYSDISKFTGKSYSNLGFKPLKNAITQPNYVWYNHSNNNVVSRYNTQKAQLVKIGLDKYGDTEDEIMYNLGYYKIYNSGNIAMEWRKDV